MIRTRPTTERSPTIYQFFFGPLWRKLTKIQSTGYQNQVCHGQNINIECSRGPNRFLTQNLDAALERLHASRKILFRRQSGSHFQG